MSLAVRTSLLLVPLAAAALLAGCERPPMDSKQQGFRGTGMVQIDNPRIVDARRAENVPPAVLDPAEPGGPNASATFKNVQVLGDLSVGEFNRTMLAITAWVSPTQGCAYCHEGADFAGDTLYTKVVARRMLQMTQHINSDWSAHVAQTGVTCYTCHRGQPIPASVWTIAPPSGHDGSMVGAQGGQNSAAPSVGYTSLPFDPFTLFLHQKGEIRVVSDTALPAGSARTIKQTEATYGLMMHVSDALGVNCTFCHNSRSFKEWDQSAPQRVTAWHGIRMVRDLNQSYLDPLKPQYPRERLGPLGDAPKASCATCHQGASKPLYGAAVAKHYPALLTAHGTGTPADTGNRVAETPRNNLAVQ
jgi:photosynthetic reaction center cytochrome c subunit